MRISTNPSLTFKLDKGLIQNSMMSGKKASESARGKRKSVIIIKIIISFICIIMILFSVYKAFLAMNEGDYMDASAYGVHLIMYCSIIILLFVIRHPSET